MSRLRENESRYGHVESEVALNGVDIVTSEAPNAAIIDATSMAEYRRQFEKHRQQNKQATKAESSHHLKEYIKKKIDGIVDDACEKRMLDVTTVGVSVMFSTFVPYSGVGVVLAGTLTQCFTFAFTLGLIPLLNVRSASDVTAMMSRFQKTVEQAAEGDSIEAIESVVLEILKELGLDDGWLWVDILKDILVEMIDEGATDSTWILTPFLAVPKYKMHRHLIKKMYRKLGDKAHAVHHTWVELNCVQQCTESTGI